MFRLTFFRFIIKKENEFSQISKNLGYLNECRCMSNINWATKKINASNVERDKFTPTKKNEITEQEFLVRLKDDPDTFGMPEKEEIVDEGDLQEERYFTEQPLASQKLRTKQYADIIKDLISQRRIKEAIDVLEVRMLKEDRVKPESYIYNLLLGACGRVGYTKKAFKLYNDMKRRALPVIGGTYTALFNACANSPWPLDDGITRATHLREIMIEKGHKPNLTTYNAMIKAFGRCGDLQTAFTLVDEMSSRGFEIKEDTINFLLQACITDKEAGFRHGLLVWRKLINKKILPNGFTYNLMLRNIRDCGMGDLEVTKNVVNRILLEGGSADLEFNLSDNFKRHHLSSETNNEFKLDNSKEHVSTDVKAIDATEPNMLATNITETETKVSSETANEFIEINLNDSKDLESTEPETVNEEQLDVLETVGAERKLSDLRPNLMATVPHLENIISLSEITKPEERLLLVGGCKTFLENMKENKCAPDIKTFTLLLDCIPNTLAAEKELIHQLEYYNIKPDIDFYNMLIKRKSLRFDYDGAKDVIMYMKELGYRPNLITYGVLALGCKTKEEGLELIQEMKSKSYTLNIEILGAMLHQACHHSNLRYVLELMEICVRENIQPSKKFVEMLNQFKKKCSKELDLRTLSTNQEKRFFFFKERYRNWLQEVQIDETEDEHPWQQFKQSSPESSTYRWKDSTSRFKPQRLSRFKVKTSPKYKT